MVTVPTCSCTLSAFSTRRPQYSLLYPSDFRIMFKIACHTFPAEEVGSWIDSEGGMERMSICVGSAILMDLIIRKESCLRNRKTLKT
jgi:hypothetical protein